MLKHAPAAALALALVLLGSSAQASCPQNGDGCVAVDPYAAPMAGTGQNGVSLASAQHLTVPTGAIAAEVTFEGSQVRCTTDGTTPTGSIGTPYNPGDHIFPRGSTLATLQCIGVSSGATLDAEYFQ